MYKYTSVIISIMLSKIFLGLILYYYIEIIQFECLSCQF